MINEKTTEIANRDDAYIQFERLDETQIADEVKGIYAKTLVYQFEDRTGKIITGLSIKGVYEVAKAMVRLQGYDIKVEKANILEENADELKASCKATFTAPNGKMLEMWGYSKASKFYFKGAPNEFAWVQALSKAQRNALRTLIPENFATECIKEYLADKRDERVQKITPTPQKPIAPAKETQISSNFPYPDTILEKPVTTAPPQQKMMTIRFITDAPRTVGMDLKDYGPFKPEDIANIPAENAELMIKQKFAIPIDAQAPTPAPISTMDLVYQGKKYGTAALKEGEVEVTFDTPVLHDTALLDNFLFGRVIEPLREKADANNQFIEVGTDEDESGLKRIHLIGDVTEATLKAMANPCAWVAAKSSDKAKQ